MGEAILNGGKAIPGRGKKRRDNGSLFCRKHLHNHFFHCRVLNFPFRSRNMNYPRLSFLLPFCNKYRCLHKQKQCLSAPPQRQASRQRVAIWKSKISCSAITFLCLVLLLAALLPFLGGAAAQKKQFTLYLFCGVWFYIIYFLFYFYCAELVYTPHTRNRHTCGYIPYLSWIHAIAGTS